MELSKSPRIQNDTGKVNTSNSTAYKGNVLQDGLELAGTKEGEKVRTPLM